jgi:hypothetical protein
MRLSDVTEKLDIPNDVQAQVDEAGRTHDERKRVAFAEYSPAIAAEALALVLRNPHRVQFLPYVEHGLYSAEVPEERDRSARARLH